MKCNKCHKEFPTFMIIDGKRRNLQRRKFCMKCSPFGERNTIDLNKRPETVHCVQCNAVLRFNQLLYCSSSCKSTHSETVNQSTYKCQQGRALARKVSFVNKLGGKCEKCGYNKNLAALIFHHLDPRQKTIPLDARNLSNRKESKLLEELEKCSLLCQNCHAEIHYPYLNLDLIIQADCSDH